MKSRGWCTYFLSDNFDVIFNKIHNYWSLSRMMMDLFSDDFFLEITPCTSKLWMWFAISLEIRQKMLEHNLLTLAKPAKVMT